MLRQRGVAPGVEANEFTLPKLGTEINTGIYFVELITTRGQWTDLRAELKSRATLQGTRMCLRFFPSVIVIARSTAADGEREARRVASSARLQGNKVPPWHGHSLTQSVNSIGSEEWELNCRYIENILITDKAAASTLAP